MITDSKWTYIFLHFFYLQMGDLYNICFICLPVCLIGDGFAHL